MDKVERLRQRERKLRVIEKLVTLKWDRKKCNYNFCRQSYKKKRTEKKNGWFTKDFEQLVKKKKQKEKTKRFGKI